MLFNFSEKLFDLWGMNLRFFSIVLLSLVIVACSDDPKQNSRAIKRSSSSNSGPSFRIRLLNAQGLVWGDSLSFEVKSDDEEMAIEQLEISSETGGAIIIDGKTDRFSIASSVAGGGEVTLKFRASYGNGKETTRYKEILIKPRKEENRWKFEVVDKYPHDVSSYTQGFLIKDGFVYEGTGNYGESKLRKLDLRSGKVFQERSMSDDVFGEGITIRDGKIFQLTYKSGRGYLYNVETFDLIDEFSYYTKTGEGWGLTHNDTCLILSDGSSILYFLDPSSLEEKGRLNVYTNDGNVSRLNELEYVDGTIYANIYTEPFIVAINAKSGEVTDLYNAQGIVDPSEANQSMDVLNGIAVNPMSGNLLLTGKYWSRIYEVNPTPLGGD